MFVIMAFFGKDSEASSTQTQDVKQRVMQEAAQELAVADVTELINVSSPHTVASQTPN